MEANDKVKFKVNEKHGLAAIGLVIILVLLGLKFFRDDPLRLTALKTELPHMVNFIRSFPVGAPVVLFGLVFLQSAVPIIPFFLLAGAGGIVFGMFWGLIIIWCGAVLGACFTFSLARYLGKDGVQHWLDKRGWDYRYSVEKGFLAILVSRLIPVVPSVAVNIVSGLSKVRFSEFALATTLGKLPWAFLYTSLGYNLSKGKIWAIYLALAVMALMLAMVIYRWLSRHNQTNSCP